MPHYFNFNLSIYHNMTLLIQITYRILGSIELILSCILKYIILSRASSSSSFLSSSSAASSSSSSTYNRMSPLFMIFHIISISIVDQIVIFITYYICLHLIPSLHNIIYHIQQYPRQEDIYIQLYLLLIYPQLFFKFFSIILQIFDKEMILLIIIGIAIITLQYKAIRYMIYIICNINNDHIQVYIIVREFIVMFGCLLSILARVYIRRIWYTDDDIMRIGIIL